MPIELDFGFEVFPAKKIKNNFTGYQPGHSRVFIEEMGQAFNGQPIHHAPSHGLR